MATGLKVTSSAVNGFERKLIATSISEKRETVKDETDRKGFLFKFPKKRGGE